jgi:hypothetical protein
VSVKSGERLMLAVIREREREREGRAGELGIG